MKIWKLDILTLSSKSGYISLSSIGNLFPFLREVHILYTSRKYRLKKKVQNVFISSIQRYLKNKNTFNKKDQKN